MHVIFRATIFSKHFSFASFSFVATKENEEETMNINKRFLDVIY
jgi:hypothetical protein